MALIGSFSVCAICEGPLDRPYTATSGVAFAPGHPLYEYCDAPLHLDCLAIWPDREEFSRGYFLGALASHWRGRGTVLHATARWYLGCGPGGKPQYAVVRLRDWPFRLYSPWADWTAFVEGDYRDDLMGSALEAAHEVIAEVRRQAATLEALEALLLTSAGQPQVLRSYAEFGDFLATLWGEEAYATDWELRDAEEAAIFAVRIATSVLTASASSRETRPRRATSSAACVAGHSRAPRASPGFTSSASMDSRLLRSSCAEDLVEGHGQHRLRPSRSPVDSLVFDTIVLPEPNDCDASAFGIDDPVLGDASLEVKRLLLFAITTPGAWRDDLHDEERNGPRAPARVRVWMGQPNHEIRLDLRAPGLNHGAWPVHVTEPVRGDEGRKDAVEPRRDLLVVHRRGRCHEQLSAHQLVLVAVVRQTVELLERPHLRLCRHGKGHTPLGRQAERTLGARAESRPSITP